MHIEWPNWLRGLAPAVLAVALAMPATAQVKPKRCLSQAEVKAEQLIRHGIFLREAGNRCEDWVPGTRQKWLDFDGRFGTKLRSQTDRRIKFFQKEFKADALKVMTYFDGRLVTYYRHYPLSQAYCTNVDKMLTEVGKRGWGAFATQAETVQNEVYLDYKICQ